MEALKEKGVEAVYCLSVNDKYVMRAWAESTTGIPYDHHIVESSIQGVRRTISIWSPMGTVHSLRPWIW